jgi:hypothetical protein
MFFYYMHHLKKMVLLLFLNALRSEPYFGLQEFEKIYQKHIFFKNVWTQTVILF